MENYSCILFLINFTVIFILTATLLRLKVHMEAMRYLLYKKERYRYNKNSRIVLMNLLFIRPKKQSYIAYLQGEGLMSGVSEACFKPGTLCDIKCS